MTTSTSDLATWLLAQIDALQQAAEFVRDHGSMVKVTLDGPGAEILATFYREMSPARVLAQCKAHRAIVEMCRPRYVIAYRESERLLADAFDQETVQTVAHSDPIWPFEGAETILRSLALPFASHPDYDERSAL